MVLSDWWFYFQTSRTLLLDENVENLHAVLKAHALDVGDVLIFKLGRLGGITKLKQVQSYQYNWIQLILTPEYIRTKLQNIFCLLNKTFGQKFERLTVPMKKAGIYRFELTENYIGSLCTGRVAFTNAVVCVVALPRRVVHCDARFCHDAEIGHLSIRPSPTQAPALVKATRLVCSDPEVTVTQSWVTDPGEGSKGRGSLTHISQV